MSFILLGILNSSAGASWGGVYYLSSLESVSTFFGTNVVTDSSSNVYSLGWATGQGAGGYDLVIVKHDAAGVIQWQRNLGGTSTERGNGIALDSANNVYVTGYTQTSPALQDWLLVKYNSSGVLQWQKRLDATNASGAAAIAIDSSDNVYLTGNIDTGGSYQLKVAKFNSSGVVQWQKLLGDSGTESGEGIALDSSGNLYVTGWGASGTGYDIIIAKYNSSGTLQWQRILTGASAENGRGVAVDSSGGVYIIGETSSDGAGATDFIIAKYNSSGTLQWQRNLGNGNGQVGNAIATDSSDNVYVTGTNDGDWLIAKYNSSGTIQWQRSFEISSSANGIHIDANDILYVTGRTRNKYQVIFKLPNDGSLTDTYTLDGVSTVYSVSSLTAQTSALTSSTSGYSTSTDSLSNVTTSLTDQAISLTQHFAGIG